MAGPRADGGRARQDQRLAPRADDAVYKNGMIVNGLGYITTDELHAYEEGLNSTPSACI